MSEIITLVHPKGVGKSPIADAIIRRLKAIDSSCVLVSQDDFRTPFDQDQNTSVIDHENPIRWEALRRSVRSILAGESTKSGEGLYDFVLVEGDQILSQPETSQLLESSTIVFLQADEQGIPGRRIARGGEDLETIPTSSPQQEVGFVLNTTARTVDDLAMLILKRVDERRNQPGTHSRWWWEIFWLDDSNNFGHPRQELIDRIINFRNGRSDFTAVDVASGNGRYAIPLALKGCRTKAVEITTSGINRIQNLAIDMGVEVETMQGDFLKLSKEPHQFDAIICSGLLEELDTPDDQIAAVYGLQSWTKPGGLLILKFCLEIDGRGIRTADNLILPLFKEDVWDILEHKADPTTRGSLTPISFENMIRTETIIAKRKEMNS
jgi:hypothetical protein